MVNNLKRGGWEMPGGKIENGETVEEAAVREYIEESGYSVRVLKKEHLNGCWVCCCELLGKLKEGEMETSMFKELPKELSFPLDEYRGVIEWSRSVIGTGFASKRKI